MSSYLRYFELERAPFEDSGQARVVLGTRALRGAFTTIRSGIEEGASRICVSGEAGMGKTSLARALPKLLGDAARVAVVPDPTICWEAARPVIARQWGLETGGLARSALLEVRRERPLVLVVDQAERADQDFLDHLDVLLCYRTESDAPVVQSVLMARLTGSSRSQADGSACPLIWWLDRIQTLQLEFAPLPRDGVAPYIEKHLKRAGHRGPAIFHEDATQAIHGHTGGVPGAISELCERLLVEAAARSLDTIDATLVHSVCEPRADAMDGGTAETAEPMTTAMPDAVARPFAGDAEEANARPFAGDAEEANARPFAGDAEEVAAHRSVEDATKPPRDAPTDAAFGLDADALLAPPTEAELRSLRGHPLARFARPLLGALAASLVGGVLIALAAPGPDHDALRVDQARTNARSAAAAADSSVPPVDDAASPRTRRNGDAPVLFAPAGGFVPIAQAPAPGETRKKAGDGTLPDAGSAERRATPAIADAREDPIPVEPTTARDPSPSGAAARRSLPAAPSPASTRDR